MLRAPPFNDAADTRGLVSAAHPPAPPAPPPSSSHVAFSSRRQLHLHAYDPSARRVPYVETKIGGHPLDHRLLLHAHARPHGPLKTLPRVLLRLGARQSRAFDTPARAPLEYAPTKIGGHALDHVPFCDRGLPSRPLWGFSPTPQARPEARRTLLHSPRVLAELYACSRCRRLRAAPRVQLCCGHALCAACLAADDLRHVAAPSCLLECRPCADFVAVEAVVFPPDRVLLVRHADGAAVSLHELAQREKHAPQRLRWKTGSALAALALAAAGKLLYPAPSIRTSNKTAEALESEATLRDAADADDALEGGETRWKKRVAGLRAPSKLLKFSFVRTLGVGNFAEVMLVRDRKGALCVLKESDKLQEAVNEIGLLSKIRSPHVVEIREYFVEEIGHRHFAYIVMEYCDQGDLLQQIQTTGALSATAFNAIFRQLCLGLSEIHARGIIHRDLKPGNVLLTSEGIAKIADFGVSTCLESNLLTHHAAGTLAFMAPEVRRYFLGEDVSYDAKADIWSLGALAVAMLSGDAEPRVATRVVDEVVEELVEKFALSDLHATLLQRTLDIDPRKRPSLAELLDMVPPMNARL